MAYNKLIDLNLLSNFLNKIKGLIPTKVSNLENDSGYINEITSSDIITALGYTPSSTDALPLTGGTMSGNINMGSNKVTNLSAPTANGDATSKEYVDNLITIGSTQPATTQTKIWLDPADTTSSATEIWVPTISEMNEALAEKEQAGLGISNASVGDFICVSEVDANGKPTSWTRVAQSDVINSSYRTASAQDVIDAAQDTEINTLKNQITDSGWKNLTLTSAFTLYSTNAVARYRKIGNLVMLQGQIKPTSEIAASSTNIVMSTLPSGFRPNLDCVFVCQGSIANRWALTAYANGNLGVARYGTTEFVAIPTNAWLVFNVMFFIG